MKQKLSKTAKKIVVFSVTAFLLMAGVITYSAADRFEYFCLS